MSIGVALITFATYALGCSGDVDPPIDAQASALRRVFPDQTPLVLERGEAFIAARGGFIPSEAAPGAWYGVAVVLPNHGSDPIRLSGFGGVEVRVREIGLGAGALVERAVVYERAGGAAFWTAASGIVEEWLHLDASAVHQGSVVAAWEVEGATLRRQGDAVEIVTDGVVRLRVTAPVAYAAGGREVATRIEPRGGRIELSVEAAGEPVLIGPVWTAAGSMATKRWALTTTLLPNGKVLAVAGDNDPFHPYLASVELYNPATNMWTMAASLITGRVYQTATLLPSGSVLVAGGTTGSGASITTLASAELYDPVADTWQQLPPMLKPRQGHTATLLPNGKVLLAGGLNATGWESSTEIFDPLSNSYATAAAMTTVRGAQTATLLPDGTVLVVGGEIAGSTTLASAEVYDPIANTWTPAGSLIAGRYGHTATRLGNGKVLVTGGCGGGNCNPVLTDAELYDPTTRAWTPTAPTLTPHATHTATLLGDGTVLIAGGSGNEVELYDPVAGTWSPTASLLMPRGGHSANMLGNGKVLVAGGANNSPAFLATAELYVTPIPCTTGSDCATGFCADSVCCNTACNAGPCDACSIAAGAAIDGTCSLLTGPACNDGDACTQVDTCQMGVCTGGDPVTCSASVQCHATGTCDSATGQCDDPSLPDGLPCDDGNACTQSDTCQAGACASGAPVTCAAMDQCHAAGMCDQVTGQCSNPSIADGTACNDGNACTQLDACQSGMCTGANPVSCTATDNCHDDGTCDPTTGQCFKPVKADGTACAGGTCVGGVCTTPDAGADGGGGDGSDTGGSGTSGSGGITSGSGGTSSTGSTPEPELDMSGGCSCTMPGSEEAPRGAASLVALMAVWGARRRRVRSDDSRMARSDSWRLKGATRPHGARDLFEHTSIAARSPKHRRQRRGSSSRRLRAGSAGQPKAHGIKGGETGGLPRAARRPCASTWGGGASKRDRPAELAAVKAELARRARGLRRRARGHRGGAGPVRRARRSAAPRRGAAPRSAFS